MNTADASKKTALFEEHRSAGAKIVPFGGWQMPVSYESVLAEHKRVREQCGLFDVSHMGEIRVKGKDAEAFVQWLTVNDVRRLGNGQGQYSAILHEHGGMIDDLIVYRLKSDEFFICVNASNTEKDYAWFRQHAERFNVAVTNESSAWSQLAVQGPQSRAALDALLPKAEHARLDYMEITEVSLFGEPALIARTGYTGEHGYEIYLPNAIAARVWRALLATAPQTGIAPIGLGARDTLRLEACYLLYGNDMDDTVSPLEAGISWAVRLDAGDFIGKAALEAQKASGVPRKMVAFKLEDDGVARGGMLVYRNGEAIGKVTSGSVLPTLGGAGGMALVSNRAVKDGDTMEVDVRGKRKLARVVKRPLYSARVK